MLTKEQQEVYKDFTPYKAVPTEPTTLMDVMSSAALIAWFRCNSCYTCQFRAEVLEKDADPNHDIHWCSKTHDRANIIDMVSYLGYTKEGREGDREPHFDVMMEENKNEM